MADVVDVSLNAWLRWHGIWSVPRLAVGRVFEGTPLLIHCESRRASRRSVDLWGRKLRGRKTRFGPLVSQARMRLRMLMSSLTSGLTNDSWEANDTEMASVDY